MMVRDLILVGEDMKKQYSELKCCGTFKPPPSLPVADWMFLGADKVICVEMEVFIVYGLKKAKTLGSFFISLFGWRKAQGFSFSCIKFVAFHFFRFSLL